MTCHNHNLGYYGGGGGEVSIKGWGFVITRGLVLGCHAAWTLRWVAFGGSPGSIYLLDASKAREYTR